MKDKLTFSALLLFALFSPLAPAALASTTWYVNGVSGNDSNNCKSPLTACQTIGHAISLASSGDTIRVASAIYSEHLTIGISLNVLGAGASTTIIDGGSSGGTAVVFVSNAAAYVTFSGLTIQNGSGGGIYNDGILTINNSTVANNRVSCDYSGKGGGIYNGGEAVTINKSTITGNTADSHGYSPPPPPGKGGGIYNHAGTLMINNSTVSGNDATSVFCSLLGCTPVSGSGGGIYNAGTLIISNDTFSGNSAVATGGGIFNSIGGTAALKNSIVADSPTGANCAGTMTSEGYNLSSDSSCNFTGPGDMNNTDPKLGTLGNYGGPTETIPLLSGSPAIDAGNPSGCTDSQGHLLRTDQRGVPRPDKEDTGGCDMGAYERQSD